MLIHTTNSKLKRIDFLKSDSKRRFRQVSLGRKIKIGFAKPFLCFVKNNFTNADFNLLSFFFPSPQWCAATAQIQSSEFFLHCRPLVRTTAGATRRPYPRLLGVLPESWWSRKPAESARHDRSQILRIRKHLGKGLCWKQIKKLSLREHFIFHHS